MLLSVELQGFPSSEAATVGQCIVCVLTVVLNQQANLALSNAHHGLSPVIPGGRAWTCAWQASRWDLLLWFLQRQRLSGF